MPIIFSLCKPDISVLVMNEQKFPDFLKEVFPELHKVSGDDKLLQKFARGNDDGSESRSQILQDAAAKRSYIASRAGSLGLGKNPEIKIIHAQLPETCYWNDPAAREEIREKCKIPDIEKTMIYILEFHKTLTAYAQPS